MNNDKQNTKKKMVRCEGVLGGCGGTQLVEEGEVLCPICTKLIDDE